MKQGCGIREKEEKSDRKENYKTFSVIYYQKTPVTVAERSKACTDFALSDAGIVGSNLTQGMGV
jgi:hypothetical protein